MHCLLYIQKMYVRLYSPISTGHYNVLYRKIFSLSLRSWKILLLLFDEIFHKLHMTAYSLVFCIFYMFKNLTWLHFFKALYTPVMSGKAAAINSQHFVYFYTVSFKIMGLASTCLPSHFSMLVYLLSLDVATLSCYFYKYTQGLTKLL